MASATSSLSNLVFAAWAALTCGVAACASPPAGRAVDQRAVDQRAVGQVDLGAAKPAPVGSSGTAPSAPIDKLDSPAAQLALAYHRRWVRGEIKLARRGLAALLRRSDAAEPLRAKAALWLAEIAELRGEKRAALAQLEAAKRLAGPATALARLADDRRARIVSSAPLADVRGPAPGSVRLRETPQINALFRRAEQRLVTFHRVVVRPRIENIDSVRRGKQAALSRAVVLYEQVEKQGSARAKAAARFRIAAMYHHMAEALAFERPPELLEKFARKLTRRLRAESVAYLGRALSSYRAVERIAGAPRWRRLAQREAQTLAPLLGSKKKGKSKR